MCRLILYVGSSAVSLHDLLIRPSHSITKQSYSCRERFGDGLSGLPPALNADGFGVGWYSDLGAGEGGGDGSSGGGSSSDAAVALPFHERPGVYTSVSPCWNDVNLPRLATKIASKCVFAHVRAASLGTGVHIMNAHPFSQGRYLFMHNGHIAAFGKLRRRILGHLSDRALAGVKGTTDSEHLVSGGRPSSS